jgi:hypothetical protein
MLCAFDAGLHQSVQSMSMQLERKLTRSSVGWEKLIGVRPLVQIG